MMCYKSKEQHPPFYILDEIFKFFSQRENHSKPEPERTITKEIESLIASTITYIKAALDKDEPGEAKVYTEMLVLLRSTLNIQSPGSNRTLRATSGGAGQTYEKPFEKISEKHILDTPLTRG